MMKRNALDDRLFPSFDEGPEEVHYLELKICRLCTLTKLIPEKDNICEDCWILRMEGRALVTCHSYLYEESDLYFSNGRVPIKLCYDCAHRDGWAEQLEPLCNHPIAVPIADRGGSEMAQCPKESTLVGWRSWVPMCACKTCPWYRGELTNRAGRFTYCGIPNRFLQKLSTKQSYPPQRLSA